MTAAVDTLLAAGKAATDPAKRRAIYKQLLARLATDLPYLPLYAQQSAYAISSKFSWKVNPYNWYNGHWALAIKPK